jgi:uncharacterized protein YprB with RNaseH-like and TPR domain
MPNDRRYIFVQSLSDNYIKLYERQRIPTEHSPTSITGYRNEHCSITILHRRNRLLPSLLHDDRSPLKAVKHPFRIRHGLFQLSQIENVSISLLASIISRTLLPQQSRIVYVDIETLDDPTHHDTRRMTHLNERK